MGLLDWVKNRGKEKQHETPEEASGRQYTKRGNAIRVLRQGEWHTDHPGYETKQLIGRSVEGYHGGRQVSVAGGDGPIVWSNARPTIERAEKASFGISGPDEYGDAQRGGSDLHPRQYGHETWAGLFAEIRGDEALRNVRDETGREAESGNPKEKRERGPSIER